MRILFLIIFIVTAPACLVHAQTMTPLEFNNRIAYITDSLFAKGKAWGTAMAVAHKDGDFREAKSLRQDLERYLKEKIAIVESMTDVGDSKPLRSAMIKFLRYEQKMIHDAFLPFESIPQGDDEKFQTAFNNLQKLSVKESKMLLKVHAQQRAYAKKNGFTIEGL